MIRQELKRIDAAQRELLRKSALLKSTHAGSVIHRNSSVTGDMSYRDPHILFDVLCGDQGLLRVA